MKLCGTAFQDAYELERAKAEAHFREVATDRLRCIMDAREEMRDDLLDRLAVSSAKADAARAELDRRLAVDALGAAAEGRIGSLDDVSDEDLAEMVRGCEGDEPDLDDPSGPFAGLAMEYVDRDLAARASEAKNAVRFGHVIDL